MINSLSEPTNMFTSISILKRTEDVKNLFLNSILLFIFSPFLSIIIMLVGILSFYRSRRILIDYPTEFTI